MTDTLTACDDVSLVCAIANGEHQAFEALVKQHGGQMMAVARRLLRSEEDVNDAMQEALVCVFKNARQFQHQSRLSKWLHRIVVNACLMKLRTQRRRHAPIEEMLPTFDETGHRISPGNSWGDGPLERASSTELRSHVRESIDRLPETHRTVLLLRDIEELDTAETARLLECSEACVKTRLHRARQALRTLLAPTFESEVMA